MAPFGTVRWCHYRLSLSNSRTGTGYRPALRLHPGPPRIYAYDGRGRRSVKVAVGQSGANRTYTIYVGAIIVSEFADASTATYTSGTAPGQAPSDAVSTLLYQQQDHLTTREATDNSGNVAYQRGNFPYGDMWYDTGTASFSVMRKYTSYQMEPELSGSLNYAMAREHSARLGRFHLPDPEQPTRRHDPQLLNRYAYVAGDPINRSDPNGRQFGFCDDSPFRGEGFLGDGGGDALCSELFQIPPPIFDPEPPCGVHPSPPAAKAEDCDGRAIYTAFVDLNPDFPVSKIYALILTTGGIRAAGRVTPDDFLAQLTLDIKAVGSGTILWKIQYKCGRENVLPIPFEQNIVCVKSRRR
jgi:RHS repeat-associated protein